LTGKKKGLGPKKGGFFPAGRKCLNSKKKMPLDGGEKLAAKKKVVWRRWEKNCWEGEEPARRILEVIANSGKKGLFCNFRDPGEQPLIMTNIVEPA